MNKNEPNNPYPERTVELRIEMIDPDNFKMGAKGFIPESQLTDISIDPREVLFKALQEIAQQIVREAFKEETPEEAHARLLARNLDPQ